MQKLTPDQQIGLFLAFLIVFFTVIAVRSCDNQRQCVNDMLQKSGSKLELEEVKVAEEACL